MILKKEVINKLSKLLGLQFTGIEQDWDVEMASSERLREFIDFYKNSKLNTEEKVAIMALIIASFDDLLTENNCEFDNLWKEIEKILLLEKDIFSELLIYWGLGSEKENIFRVTPLIRRIVNY